MSASVPGEPRWRRYLRFFGPRGVADLDDELRFHVEMRVRDYIARGMSESEARAATAQRLGDLALARDTCATIATRRDTRMRRAQLIDAFTQDVRFALRTLARQKTWAAVAVITLALGIGATSAMYSVVNHLILNPTPYPGGDRVVVLFQQPSQGNNTGMSVALTPMGRVVAAWREHARSFEALEPYQTNDVTLASPNAEPRTVHTGSILPSFAAFAAERPLIGRLFTAAEAAGGGDVLLLGEGMWRARYGGEPDALGKTIRVNERLYTIIGVMPASFQLPRAMEDEMDLWLPLDFARADDDGMKVIGRLRRGVSSAAAGAELDSITRRTEAANSTSSRYTTVVRGPAESLRFGDMLLLLSSAVALVLLIACANVAHLLLARAATRQRELSIRAALGAGTGRLFRQLLTESLILSIAGCAGGLVVGWASLRALVAARPESLSVLTAVRMDQSTLFVTAALAVATGLAFGVIGAMQASRHSASETLKAGAQTSSEGRLRVRGRGLLVVTEMALCTALLVGASLMIRSIMHLQVLDPGFDASGLYAMHVELPRDRYASPAARQAFYQHVAERAAKIPGFTATTIAAAPPLSSAFLIGALQVEGQPDPPKGTTAFVPYNAVLPDYFSMLKMPIIRGSTFTDTSEAAAQAIVNEAMADSLWRGRSPLGSRVRVVYNGQGQWRTVVGVVRNALTRGLTQRSVQPMLFVPGAGSFTTALVVRTSGDGAPTKTLASIVSSADARLAHPSIQNIEEGMRRSIARPRFTMFLLTVLTSIAVGLAAVGLYGVLAYTVAQRTREIGIRMALGASRRAVAGSVLRQGLGLALFGAMLGLIVARWGSTIVGSMLYGVRPTDGASFAAGAAVLFVIATLACLIPVRRAVAVDPIIAVKAD
jgi:putative ABC transport system permease protein